MKTENGKHGFGFWDGMPYKSQTDRFEDFKQYKNDIPKDKIISHIESLDPWLATTYSNDIFTGEIIDAGIYKDNDFVFPIDFLRYYRTMDIGIPKEYEDYLKTLPEFKAS